MAVCGKNCVKYLMFIFNLIFVISGVILITVGALILTAFRQLLNNYGGSYANVAAAIVIVAGVIVFVISFFGCCGAIRENYCMIIIFATFLCLILVIEFAVAIAAFVMRDNLKNVVEEVLRKEIPKYHIDNEVTISLDTWQKELKCCGAANYTDWLLNEHLNGSVPESCCIEPVVHQCNVTGLALASEEYAKNMIRTAGCVDGMSAWARGKVGLLGGIAAGLTLIQVLGIILAVFLAKSIREGCSEYA